MMKQFVVTPSMGKRLIARGIVQLPAVREAMRKGILAIVAGTTNGYVAQEVLAALGQEGFSPAGFRRGMVTPPGFDVAAIACPFPGDVVIVNGQWQRGKEFSEFVDAMKPGDVILKGANAVNLERGTAAVLIGHPMGGSGTAAITAVAGRRVRMIVPVGLEKRVCGELDVLAARVNDPATEGPRMLMLPGEVFTELHALERLTGVTACLLAAGGVCGAEGSVWLGLRGDDANVAKAEQLLASLAKEGPCKP